MDIGFGRGDFLRIGQLGDIELVILWFFLVVQEVSHLLVLLVLPLFKVVAVVALLGPLSARVNCGSCMNCCCLMNHRLPRLKGCK